MAKRGRDFLERKAISFPESVIYAVSTRCGPGVSHLYGSVQTWGASGNRWEVWAM